MHICNTDEALVLKARDIMQKIDVNPYVRVQKSSYGANKKLVYRIQTKRLGNIQRLLQTTAPYLTGNKKERAELMLEFCNSRIGSYIKGSHKIQPYTQRECEIVDLCAAKQKRGASETLRKGELEYSLLIWKEQQKRVAQYKQKYQKLCAFCEKPLEHGQERFCSKTCYWEWMRANNSQDIVQPLAKAIG
jgi:hypothetical protein